MDPLISVDAGTLAFLGQGIEEPFIVAGFYAENEEIAQLINYHIQQRTAVDRGGLIASEKYEVNHDPNSVDMVVWYADDSPQLAAWNRVYVAYQEGGQYGKPTYTNPPRLMYAKIETDDLPLIEAWATVTLQNRIDKLPFIR